MTRKNKMFPYFHLLLARDYWSLALEESLARDRCQSNVSIFSGHGRWHVSVRSDMVAFRKEHYQAVGSSKKL
jgi:hypothetical protein